MLLFNTADMQRGSVNTPARDALLSELKGLHEEHPEHGRVRNIVGMWLICLLRDVADKDFDAMANRVLPELRQMSDRFPDDPLNYLGVGLLTVLTDKKGICESGIFRDDST